MFSDFLSLVKNKGLATHNHYYVSFDIPKGLRNKYPLYGSSLSLLCSGGEFPATNMTIRKIFWQGATKPTAVAAEFNEMFLFFYLEQDMTLKTFIDDWFRVICNPIDGTVGYNDDYSTQIRIYQLNREFMPVYAVQLVNAFPKATFPLQITYQGGQLHRLPVSFTYRYWENINIKNTTGFWGDLLNTAESTIAKQIAPQIFQ